MDVLLYLIPLALVIGLLWLAFFVWSIRNNQFDDLEGAAQRILIDEEPPAKPEKPSAPDEAVTGQ
jgi:cbb3-type cytochrome oxidase maturation protein